ncbi:unnamed protein product [Schistosoma guineensis]|nr:unnamed protein product [Schistosoma guineensis]
MAGILNSCQSLFLEKSNVLNKHTTCIFIHTCLVDLLNVLIHLRLLNISDLAINGLPVYIHISSALYSINNTISGFCSNFQLNEHKNKTIYLNLIIY